MVVTHDDLEWRSAQPAMQFQQQGTEPWRSDHRRNANVYQWELMISFWARLTHGSALIRRCVRFRSHVGCRLWRFSQPWLCAVIVRHITLLMFWLQSGAAAAALAETMHWSTVILSAQRLHVDLIFTRCRQD